MTDEKPAPRQSKGARAFGCGCLGVIVLVLVGVVIAIVVGVSSTKPNPSANLDVAGTLLQSDCHGLVEAQIGSGVVYSDEHVVADHNGKGPGLMASGSAAQNGSKYFFQCSGTASLTDGTVSAEKLVTMVRP
ncbi:MAG: hypothetical protein HIU88_10325 [Acidobacteria bacterium]|nr:hypothetical protein [Acidobacteriota bacterium]